MSWRGTPPTAPVGYELAQLKSGDTLAQLEVDEAARRGLTSPADRDRIGLEITRANGVDPTPSKSCTWARGVSAWVLGTGGKRGPATPENRCEAGAGFAMFVDGQKILLPAGLRPRAAVQPEAALPKPTTSKAWWVVGIGAAALVVRRLTRTRKAP